MIQDPCVDQRELMLKFDNIIQFAKKNFFKRLPDVNLSRAYGHRRANKKNHKISNIIAFKMRSNAGLTLNTF